MPSAHAAPCEGGTALDYACHSYWGAWCLMHVALDDTHFLCVPGQDLRK